MLGEKIGAEQAEQWGLIYKACDDEALMEEANWKTRTPEKPI